MNIKFGMDNFYVRYLKRFLNNEMNEMTSVLGKFDKDDLSLLIKYLNLPNVKSMFEVHTDIKNEIPELDNKFNIRYGDNSIYWTSKVISEENSNLIHNNYDKIQEICNNSGWYITNINEWVDTTMDINGDGVVDLLDRQILYNVISGQDSTYTEETKKKCDLNLDGVVDNTDLALFDNYMSSGKLYVTLTQSNRTNYFPNKDMLVFVNQFTGDFMYNTEIMVSGDNQAIDGMPHTDITGLHKMAIYKCTPGQKVTIAHNAGQAVKLVIGCSPAKLKQDITSFLLQNIQTVTLDKGEGYQYTCTSTADNTGLNTYYLCIECPSTYNQLNGFTKTIPLDVGDINFDGKIDITDYHLLARYTAEGPGSENIKWEPTPKQLAVMDTNGDGKIDVNDAIYLYRYLNHDPYIVSLGTTTYTYESDGSTSSGDNISNFLIIDGHYDHNVNIPFDEFVTNDWVVHSKFFNYLLGMAITKYSDDENITYLQSLLKEAYPEHYYDKNFFYPGYYNDNMKSLVRDYQLSKKSLTTGDLNLDGKIDETDLRLLRNYITEAANITAVENYINDKEKYPLTPQQLIEFDLNKDGVVDENDLNEMKKNFKYSKQFIQRADINKDGSIDELDYALLEKQVNGETNQLTRLDIPFILGWYDVETENLLEQDYNISGNISEVSK